MADERIAGLFVEVSARGLDAVTQGLNALRGSLEGLVRQGTSASAMGELLHFQMERLGRTMSGLFRPEIEKAVDLVRRLSDRIAAMTSAQRTSLAHWLEAGAAFVFVTSVLPRLLSGLSLLAGLATGSAAPLALLARLLAATAIGSEVGREGLGKLFAALSRLFVAVAAAAGRLAKGLAPMVRILADLVVPAVDFVAQAVRLLDSDVGKTVARWAAFYAGFALFMGLVPRVVSGIISIVTAVGRLTKALVTMQAVAGGPKAWANLAAGVAAAATTLLLLKKLEVEEKEEGRTEAPRRAGGLESFDQRFERLARASVNASGGARSPEEQQVTLLEQISGGIGDVVRAIREQRPAVAGAGR